MTLIRASSGVLPIVFEDPFDFIVTLFAVDGMVQSFISDSDAYALIGVIPTSRDGRLVGAVDDVGLIIFMLDEQSLGPVAFDKNEFGD